MSSAILVTGKVPGEWLSDIKNIARLTVWEGEQYLMPRKYLLEIIQDYDALINFAEVKADIELVQKASKLKIIANCSIGFDNLNLPLLTENKIWASNAPGFFNYPVAEYVLSGMLTVTRRILEADDFLRKGKWKEFEPGRWDGISLKDKIVGLVGLGTIGKVLRTMLLGLGGKRYLSYADSKRRKRMGAV